MSHGRNASRFAAPSLIPRGAFLAHLGAATGAAVAALIPANKRVILNRRWYNILITIPGIAARTAISLVTNMPELGTLSQKKIGALAGLAPMQFQSGTLKGVARIKGGRAPVRNALYMPSLVAMRYNEDLKDFYSRLVDAGKPKKVAIIAVMPKLITLANALLRENRKWSQIAAGIAPRFLRHLRVWLSRTPTLSVWLNMSGLSSLRSTPWTRGS